MTNDCVCAFCLNTPEHTATSCEKERGKQAKQRAKQRKSDYERKYSLKEVLTGEIR